MQQPVEREGLLFPEEKIMRYKELPTSKIERITAQADTKSTGTDFFVLPVLIKYEGKDLYYCVDCVCSSSSDYEAQYENSANLLTDNKVEDCEFESNNGGDRVSLEVNKRVLKKGWICNISFRATETNKEARIYQCSNWILQHVVFKDKKLYTPKEPYGVMMSLLAQYSTSGKSSLMMYRIRLQTLHCAYSAENQDQQESLTASIKIGDMYGYKTLSFTN